MNFLEIFKLIWFLSCCWLSEQRNIYKREVEESPEIASILRTPQKYIIKPVQNTPESSDNNSIVPPYDEVDFEDDVRKLNEVGSKNGNTLEVILRNDVADSETDSNESNGNNKLSSNICSNEPTAPYNSQNLSSIASDDLTLIPNITNPENNNNNSSASMGVRMKAEIECVARSNSNGNKEIHAIEADSEDKVKYETNEERVNSSTENNFAVQEQTDVFKLSTEIAYRSDTTTITPTENLKLVESNIAITDATSTIPKEENIFQEMLEAKTLLHPQEQQYPYPLPDKEEQSISVDFESLDVNITNNSITTEREGILGITKPPINSSESTKANDEQTETDPTSAQNIPENLAKNFASPENVLTSIPDEQPSTTRAIETTISTSSSSSTTAKPEIATEPAVALTTVQARSPSSETQSEVSTTTTTTTTSTTPEPIRTRRPIVIPGWLPNFPPRPTFSINPTSNATTSSNNQTQNNFGFGIFPPPSNWLPNLSSFFSPINILESRPPLHDIGSLPIETKRLTLWNSLVERAKSVTDLVRTSPLNFLNRPNALRFRQLPNVRAQTVLVPNNGQMLHIVFPLRYPADGHIANSERLGKNHEAKSIEKEVESREQAHQAGANVAITAVKTSSDDTPETPNASPSEEKSSLMFPLELPGPIARFVKGIMETFMPSAN